MSWVTGILICHSVMETYRERDDGEDYYAIIVEINSWLHAKGYTALHRLDGHMRNGKHPQMIVWGGGYNYFPDNEFLEFFRTRDWESKEEVFLLFNPEDGPLAVLQPFQGEAP